MKLLFIENRHKTFLLEPIAKNLSEQGHEVHWLVQNKDFTPSNERNTYIIRYPNKLKKNYKKDNTVEEVIKSDRQINHFKKKDTLYFYYYNNIIEDYLINLKPDLVFGESTAFHELLTIQNCKKLNILYLNPSTCRYPIGRFSFYKYDTLEPFAGSDELLTQKEAQEIIDQITRRKTPPDYMRSVPVSKETVLRDKLKKTLSYLKGEKYNTPNPFVKCYLEKKKKSNIKDWDLDAQGEILKSNCFNILYPLQMQPEANIDVWGRKYRNQTELVKSIAKILPENVILYVKPNPKSKYELTPELLESTRQIPNVKHLHHRTQMSEILTNIDLVVTVTGTIAIECILSNKPVVTLKKTLNNQAANCMYLDDINTQLPMAITAVKDKKFPTITTQEKISFINLLNKSSYKGVISDPFTDVNCVSESSLQILLKAFNSLLNSVSKS